MSKIELTQIIKNFLNKDELFGECDCNEIGSAPGHWYVTITDIVGTMVSQSSFIVNPLDSTVIRVDERKPQAVNVIEYMI